MAMEEAGNSIADVLLGKAEPGGRLPQTFPCRLEDDPAYINYPGEAGHVRYGEGLYVGYRYYEKKKIAPLFPFGFGVSYTQFRFGALTLSAESIGPDETIEASIEVANVGDRAGSTVAQFYIVDEQASVSRPDKELKRFVKVWLEPGEKRTAMTASTCAVSPSSTSRQGPGRPRRVGLPCSWGRQALTSMRRRPSH
jgi:beta-glucosidase